MGMRDQSWCASCGCGIMYTENEDAMCGDCATEIGTEFAETIIRYITNLKNELEHRLELADGADSLYPYLEGAVETADTILEKAQDLYRG